MQVTQLTPSGDSVPTAIRLRRKSRLVEVDFPDGAHYALSFEYLRAHSPSAEVQGHGPGQDVLQIAKENVQVLRIEPVGHYAVRLVFDDGHDTGLYSWSYLRDLGTSFEQKWARYLKRLDGIGYVRKPVIPG
ncbi:MAG TPA: DUF971 domain-containing protein [Steroidobacteraceae bacterium]|nr:DUF971 domain-containing protein [Steroidobacteraceae bacterium]